MWEQATSVRRLAINGASLFGGEAIARVATALMALVIARMFGPVALGNYGYALAIASVLIVVPDFGLHLFAFREISSSPQRAREVFWLVNWLKLAPMIAVVTFTAVLAKWGSSDAEQVLLLGILVGRALLQSFSQASMAVFKAFEQMHYVAAQQTINSLVVVGWVGVAVAVGADLPWMIAGLVVGQLAETCLGWHILRRLYSGIKRVSWDHRAFIPVVAACFPIGLTSILLAVDIRIDIVVLSRYVSDHELGEFNAAAWFILAMFLAASLLMSVLFPKLSRLPMDSSVRGSEYVSSLLKNVLLLSSLGALLLWLLAPALIPFALGPEFAPAANILRVLAPVLPLVLLNTVLFFVFIANRRQAVCLLTLGTGVVAGTLLSLLLTSQYGTAGCALAAGVRELMMSAMYLYFLMRGHHGHHARVAGRALMKVLFGASVSLALVAMGTWSPNLMPLWLATWMILVCAGTLRLLGLPTVSDWRLLTDDSL